MAFFVFCAAIITVVFTWGHVVIAAMFTDQ